MSYKLKLILLYIIYCIGRVKIIIYAIIDKRVLNTVGRHTEADRSLELREGFSLDIERFIDKLRPGTHRLYVPSHVAIIGRASDRLSIRLK